MREAREAGEECREASWAGKWGQAERAALAEMNSTVQGQGAADYAVRCEHTVKAALGGAQSHSSAWLHTKYDTSFRVSTFGVFFYGSVFSEYRAARARCGIKTGGDRICDETQKSRELMECLAQQLLASC